MSGRAGGAIVDRPAVAFAALVVVSVLTYAGFQFAIDGRVDLVTTVGFGVALAASLVGLSILRRRIGA